MPPELERNVLKLLCSYLLYDRRSETELQLAFQVLIDERHREFHNAEVKWVDCKNDKCQAAVAILKNARKPEIMVTEVAAQLMNEFAIRFQPTPGCLHASLEKKPDNLPVFGKPPEQRIIIPA